MQNKKLLSYKFGFYAEYFSILLLTLKGYRPLHHRYRSKLGEIDLIFKHLFSKNIIFVEVKARKDISMNEVLSNSQKNRISKSASFFIATNPKYSECNYRFDLIIYNNPLSINHIKNAWFANDI